ncbi:hypothetical protein G7Y79_00015g038290 [Physcia stellaris]|nr:hypothetical protein G7Y79_00015g038290 [Physcia stellaris]
MAYASTDWSSIDAHKAFISSPQYTPFSTKFGKILGSPPQLHHAHLDPHPPAPATSSTRAPVTECLTLYFPTTFDTTSFDSHWPIFKKALEEKAEGFRAASAGWMVEELELDGEKCKAWAGFLGWDSVEAHMKYRETEAFKGTIGGLREGTKAIKAYHAVFEEK